MGYQAPIADHIFLLRDVLQIEKYSNLPGFADAPIDTIEQIFEAAAKFTSEVLAPLNSVGDKHGCVWHPDNSVTTPPGFKDAYRAMVDGGWPLLSADPDYGGQGLPALVSLYRREFTPAGWARVVDVNLNSVMWAASSFRPLLAASRGSVVIVSSVAGFRATRGNPAYAASKAGAVALTKTLGAAWAGEGIRVNGIAPGLVDTKLTRVTTGNPKRAAGALSAIPAGRFGTPADMAGAALFLCSPLASYIVGQTLIVDGGMTLA